MVTTVYAPPTLERNPERQNQALQDHASKISMLTDALTNNTYGFVVGPASSTNNGFVRYDGTTGKLVKDGAAAVALATEVSGNLPVANLGSGTGAGATTFWRGDAAWSVPVLSSLTNSLGSDVSITNNTNYFTGPSVAQGSTGTWLATGTVTVQDTTTSGYYVRITDGTTVIASARSDSAANFYIAISVSGVITSPAGDLRIEVRNASSPSANCKIFFNVTGNSKDSTITAVRIA